MGKTVTELKKEYVIENIGKGNCVILCDFDSMRMIDCVDLTVKSINAFIEKPNTKFYKVVENE